MLPAELAAAVRYLRALHQVAVDSLVDARSQSWLAHLALWLGEA